MLILCSSPHYPRSFCPVDSTVSDAESLNVGELLKEVTAGDADPEYSAARELMMLILKAVVVKYAPALGGAINPQAGGNISSVGASASGQDDDEGSNMEGDVESDEEDEEDEDCEEEEVEDEGDLVGRLLSM
jgi:hypothetical protein